ncbi:MAG TPA: hypothetical protein VH268_00805 [Solirubrobacterales bacterium]|nr:hypothetical protein [Solirubrobacterales bacterium]
MSRALPLLRFACRGGDNPPDPGIEGGQTYAAGSTSDFAVPAGVRSIQVHAVGGRGAAKSGKQGGLAAAVSGALEVEPGELLWAVVGGNATGSEGGSNGGGSGGISALGEAVGGGGGGASDIRTVDPTFDPFGAPSLESRLIIAAGGGGAGALGNGTGVKANAKGGSAAEGGSSAESAGANNTIGSGGLGGGPGGTTETGNVGEGGYYYYGGSGCGSPGGNGSAGQEGLGGEGGNGQNGAPAGWGGGGGAGLFGGGGGGAGMLFTCLESGVVTSGGGGGGGSSLKPLGGGSIAVDTDAASVPEITTHWTIPGTVMSGPTGYINQTEPSFALSSEETGASFECRLTSVVEEGNWGVCGAELKASTIGDGTYVFEARAVNGEGNFDPTPATLEFFVETAPPVITELVGPSVASPTAETQPIFTFLGGSTIPVHFECAFDGAAPGPCSGEHSDRSATPLAPGSHSFSVIPIDAAGNVGTPATQVFTVLAAAPAVQQTSQSQVPASLKLGKVKLNAKKGTATVAATVNGPGELRLSGASVKSVTVRAGGAGTVSLSIKPRGKALKQLKKTGKAKVIVKVVFSLAAGGTATATKSATLRRRVTLSRRR